MDVIFLRKFQNAAPIWSFYFDKPDGFNFDAGDYVELSLPQAGPHGDKRWLSMASAPEETELMFTVKVPPVPSEYKQALLDLSPGDRAQISPAIGTFNLPRNGEDKLLFVAAGVGITPYRSMLMQIEQDRDHRDIELIYIARPNEFIFADVIAEASIPIHQTSDKVDFNWIKKRVGDYDTRICYFAGPQPLCEKLYNEALADGLGLGRLRLDYFEGYDDI